MAQIGAEAVSQRCPRSPEQGVAALTIPQLPQLLLLLRVSLIICC